MLGVLTPFPLCTTCRPTLLKMSRIIVNRPFEKWIIRQNDTWVSICETRPWTFPLRKSPRCHYLNVKNSLTLLLTPTLTLTVSLSTFLRLDLSIAASGECPMEKKPPRGKSESRCCRSFHVAYQNVDLVPDQLVPRLLIELPTRSAKSRRSVTRSFHQFSLYLLLMWRMQRALHRRVQVLLYHSSLVSLSLSGCIHFSIRFLILFRLFLFPFLVIAQHFLLIHPPNRFCNTRRLSICPSTWKFHHTDVSLGKKRTD